VFIRGLLPVALVGAAAAQQPTFRSGVEYVQIDAVVTDKDDRSVKGLTQGDFEIVERGRPQAISTFQFITVAPTRRTVVDVKAAAPSIDVASNVHGPEGRQWALVIDDLHIIELHILHTKKVVQAFLESLPAGDQVAIVFAGRSDLSQDFTNDLGAQIRAVNRIKDSLGFAYDAADQGGGSAVPRVSAADRHRYGIGTTDVLKNVAAALARSTYSRKAIAFVSEGITYPLVAAPAADPLEQSYAGDVIDRWHEALEIARKAGVPIYAIDPRGIPDCTAVRAGCAGGPPRENIQNQQNHMRELSENTGGRAFVGYADTEQAVRELVDDNNSFYLLGYYPDPLERDGKFHSVDVKIKGRSDLKVRARAGYTAPKAAKATAAESKQTLEDALGSAMPVAGLQLRAAAAPVAVGDKGMTTAITLEVTYPPLPPAKFDDTLQFGIIALDHDGKIKASMRGTYQYSATPKEGQDVSYVINAPLELPPQPLTVRVAVASQALDRVGSIHVPVEVMNPTRDQLQIGAIVLGFAGAPRQTAVPANALKGLVPIQPTLVRAFRPSDTLQIHAPLFWRGMESSSAVVTIAVKRGETTVRGTRATVAGSAGASRAIARAQQAAVTGALSLKDLAPGYYALEIEARLMTGSVTRRAVAFEVKP
jgi:VWFA-related protein